MDPAGVRIQKEMMTMTENNNSGDQNADTKEEVLTADAGEKHYTLTSPQGNVYSVRKSQLKHFEKMHGVDETWKRD